MLLTSLSSAASNFVMKVVQASQVVLKHVGPSSPPSKIPWKSGEEWTNRAVSQSQR